MRPCWAGLFLATLAGSALAAPPPLQAYYHRDPIHLGVPEGTSDIALRDLLRSELKSHEVSRLILVGLDGTTRELRGLWGVARLNRQAVLGCISMLSFDLHGAEADLVFGTWGGRQVPVSVWWEIDGALRVQPGEPGFEHFPDGPNATELIDRFGIRPLVQDDRAWNPAAIGLLEQALGRLNPAELAVIRDVPFHRRAEPGDLPPDLVGGGQGDVIALGIYRSDSAGPRIELYDKALWRGSNFVGEPGAPAPAALWTLLHEMGHALGGAATAERMASVRGPHTRLTTYAERSPEEAFAEAFAMYRADPVALERLAPELLAWFDLGGHLEP